MHTRSRTWPLNSDPVQRCRDRTGLIDSPDGSTLSLDFTTGVLDPRLTFTRLSNATFINSSGLVEWAAANFMTQSNNFAVSPWSSTNVTMSIDGSSPVGDAWKMLENNVNNVHRLDPSGVSYGNNGLPVTFSVYVKQGSGSRQAYFTISDNATGDVRSKRLNPVTGVLEGSESVGGSWTNASTSVQSVGGGWYRLVLTATKNAGTAVICRTGMSDSSGNLSYTGDSTSFLYFAGYQINPGTSAQPYNATTGSAYTAPRFDYDPTSIGTPRGLLIEGAATNELQRSNAFNTSPWYTTNFNTPSIASPSVTDPEGGTNTWYCVPSGAGAVIHGFRYNTTFTAVAYTFSIWAKAAQHDKFIISDGSSGQGACRFDLTAKTANVIAGVVTPTNPQIVEYPNGWFRCSFTMVMAAATRGITYSSYPTGASVGAFGATFTATGTDGMYFYGAQTELGSGASSYIPTGASTGNRAADVCYINSLSSFGFNTTQGTIYAEYYRKEFPTSESGYVAVFDWNASPRTMAIGNAFGAGTAVRITGWNSDISQTGTSTVNGINRVAASYGLWGGSSCPASLSVNGQAATTGTIDYDASQSRWLSIGQTQTSAGGGNAGFANNAIRKIKYWPISLPNTTLKSLTT